MKPAYDTLSLPSSIPSLHSTEEARSGIEDRNDSIYRRPTTALHTDRTSSLHRLSAQLSPSDQTASVYGLPAPIPSIDETANRHRLSATVAPTVNTASAYRLSASASPSDQTASEHSETDRNRHDRRNRTTFTREQLKEMESVFQVDNYLSRSKRAELSEKLGLPEHTIKVWFQNRRMKAKRDFRYYPCFSYYPPVSPYYPSFPSLYQPRYGHPLPTYDYSAFPPHLFPPTSPHDLYHSARTLSGFDFNANLAHFNLSRGHPTHTPTL